MILKCFTITMIGNSQSLQRIKKPEDDFGLLILLTDTADSYPVEFF